MIEVLRGRKGAARALADLELSGVRTYCCAVTWAEIFAGIRPGEEPLAEAFLSGRGEVLIDATTGRRAGAYLARYAKSHGTEVPDAFIAATAVSADLRLWTLNRRGYPMPDVAFYDPSSA